MQPPDEFRQSVRALLLDLPRVSDELLLASQRTENAPACWPSWTLLRNLRLQWQTRIERKGRSVRLLVWNRPPGAREALSAEVTLELSPTPHDQPGPAEERIETAGPAGLPPANYPQPAAAITLPRILAANAEAAVALPPGHRTGETTFLRLGADAFCGFGPGPGKQPRADEIALRVTAGNRVMDCAAGRGNPWPLDGFMRVAFALSDSSAEAPGVPVPAPALLPSGGVWDLVAETLAAPGQAHAALEEGWRTTVPPENLPRAWLALRTRWSLTRLQARVLPLVRVDGQLADAQDDNSFTVPFTTVAEAAGSLRAEVHFGLPDLIAHGETRAALAQAFTTDSRNARDKPTFPTALRALRRAAERAGISEATAREWLRGAGGRAAFLRVERSRRDDELLLIASGSELGSPALFIWIRDVAWSGPARLSGMTGEESALGGDPARLILDWTDGKQACCAFLAGMARWRNVLRPWAEKQERPGSGPAS